MAVGWLHERVAIVATIDPVDLNGSTATTDVVDMSLWHQVMIIIQLGVINNSGTNTFTVSESVNSDGSASSAISGKSQAMVGTDDAKQFVISVRADEMTKRYLVVSNAGSAHSQLGAILILAEPRHLPVASDDLSTVQTFVA